METPANIAQLCYEILTQLVELDPHSMDDCDREQDLLSQLTIVTGHLLVEHDVLLQRCQCLSTENAELSERVSYLQSYINAREEPILPCRKQRLDN